MSDLISRADALEQMAQAECGLHYDDCEADNCSCSYIQRILDIPSAEAVQIPIKLEKRYPESKDEDITDAFMRGYLAGRSSADAVQGEWIPCSKKMPKELERVNVTWLNHNPPFYYQHIKDIPQTDTAVYYRGKWYWWDATVIDILAEYGEDCNAEQIDKDIEVVAWMPLPKPYECGARMKGGDDE